MHLRHQLAVYSPIPVRALAAATAAALGGNRDCVEQLDAVLRREYAADEALLCGSGTQALQLAIECARDEIGRQATVALPAFSCFDVASAAVGAGGPVMLYDLDPLSLSPDLESLERTLAAGARVVVVAPLYGIPVDCDAIEDLASSHGAILVEDAAQGHGATHRRRPLGSLGDISTLSFGRGKGWTGGSGGAVLFRRGRRSSRQIRAAVSSANLKAATVLAAQWGLGRPSLYGIPQSIPGLELGETVYHPPREATAISRASAAALLVSRDTSEEEAERRRENAQTLRAHIAGHPGLREVASTAASSTPGYLRFPVLAAQGLGGFGDASGGGVGRLGVAASYPKELGELPALAPLLVGDTRMRGAARLVHELVTLPVHSLGSSRDWSQLVDRIESYGRGGRSA
jgi:dTDP-4-amino-4,6-dideoxygalactose transaminase